MPGALADEVLEAVDKSMHGFRYVIDLNN